MYYFEDKERQQKLHTILEEWIGTPFRHKCGVKGLGCDCIHFVIRVLEQFELVNMSRINIPNYPRDWHMHNTREILKESLEHYLNCDKINVFGQHLAGDLILSHYGKASSHIGIYYNDYVYQSITRGGVKKIRFSDRVFKRQMKYSYRIKG